MKHVQRFCSFMSIDIYSRYLPLEEFLSIAIDLSVYLTIYVKATLSRHDPILHSMHFIHCLSSSPQVSQIVAEVSPLSLWGFLTSSTLKEVSSVVLCCNVTIMSNVIMFLMSGDAGEVCVRHGLHGHLLPDSRGSGTPGYRAAGLISDQSLYLLYLLLYLYSYYFW